jgi:aarF domain-containing kinase
MLSGLQNVMASSLGPSWRSSFVDFNPIPFAAASIGQVHHAVLAASVSPTGRPARVAVKVQFPNIAESVASDLGYIRILLTAGRLLPRGLFLDKTLAVRCIPRTVSFLCAAKWGADDDVLKQVMKEELADECDYKREAACMRSFGSSERLGSDARFKVPWVWEGSTDRVLVMEYVDGISVGGDTVHHLPQADRDEVCSVYRDHATSRGR